MSDVLLTFQHHKFGLHPRAGLSLLPELVFTLVDPSCTLVIANMPKSTLQQLYQLYKEDKMVLHSMPTALIDERPSKMNDKSCLMSGSLMFFGGLQHQNGHHVPNAVAR